MSLKVRQHLLRAAMSQTDSYGQKIHSHWKQAASRRCCWQMTVAGHRQTRQEERRAPALHLIERTKASGTRPGNSAQALESQRKPPGGQSSQRTQHNNFSPLSCSTLLMRIRCVRWVLVNTHWQQMPARLPASHTKPFYTNHYFQGCFPRVWQRSHDTCSSAVHVPKMTDQESSGCAAAATSEADL